MLVATVADLNQELETTRRSHQLMMANEQVLPADEDGEE